MVVSIEDKIKTKWVCLGLHLPIAISQSFSVKFHGVSPRNLAEKTLGEKGDFYISPRVCFRPRGVPRRNATRFFSWADLYFILCYLFHYWERYYS